MRVKVSYTIDMEDVPAKVNEVVKSAEGVLDSCLATLAESRCSRNNESVAMAQLDSVRQRLKAADETIADAYGILSGYAQIKERDTVDSEVAEYATPDMEAIKGSLSFSLFVILEISFHI